MDQRCDLLFEFQEKYAIDDEEFVCEKTLVIVKLKVSPLTLSDLHQLCKCIGYATKLSGYGDVRGVLVGPEVSDPLEDMFVYFNYRIDHTIRVLCYHHSLTFEDDSGWRLTDSMVDKLESLKLFNDESGVQNSERCVEACQE